MSSEPTNFELKLVELVNKERQKAGFKPLKIDSRLVRMARAKSNDMVNLRYFAHLSPTYGSPFMMMKNYNITYRFAGENIASGYPTPKSVLQGWMNSPGHRANILKPEYTHIGVGYCYTGRGNYNHYWTQEFIGKWAIELNSYEYKDVKINHRKGKNKSSSKQTSHRKVAGART